MPKKEPEPEPIVRFRLHLPNGKAPLTPDMTKTALLEHLTEGTWIPLLSDGCLVNPLQVVMVEQV